MANRYWVGGTGTWNTSSTTNWSASSGGSSGASVPTATDSVFFDQAGTYTVTLTGALTCLDITVSAGTVTFAQGTSPTLAVSGSMSLVAGTLWTATGRITFNATTTGKTVTTNGVSFASPFSFSGTGGGWTLGSALTTTAGFPSPILVGPGTLDTSASSYAISTVFFNIFGGTVILNNSTVTVTNSGACWSVASGGTINAGTSQINCTGSSATFTGGGQTYYNVSFTNTALTSCTISDANTFNNLTFAARAASGIGTVILSANQIINGTFTVQSGATDPSRRLLIRSNSIDVARTITSAANAIFGADFETTTAAGAASWTDSTRTNYWGDCKGNTGITFATGRTVYWNLAGAQNWSATGWTNTSTGTPNAQYFPLAQDVATFTDAGSVTGTITVDFNWNIGTMDMSGRTSAMTLATGTTTPIIYGNWTNGSGTTLSGTGTVSFNGRTTQTITSAGKSFSFPITIDSISGTVQLADNITVTGQFRLFRGTFNASNYNVTIGNFLSTGTVARTLTMGSGTWTLVATTGAVWNVSSSALTVTATTAPIVVSGATAANNISFTGGGFTYGSLSFTNTAATGSITFVNSNTFASINSSRTGAYSILFTASTTTTVTNWNISGSAGNLVTIGSVTAANHTLAKAGSGVVSADYLSISRSTATPSTLTWYAGANSTDNGNNTGWIFSAAPSLSNSNFFLLFA